MDRRKYSFSLFITMLFVAVPTLLGDHASAAGESGPMINANIVSDYIITAAPTNKPECPFIGFMRFLPGGDLVGILITDMARSKAKIFSGRYTLTNGKNISFSSKDAAIPLANINGTLTWSPILDPLNPPIDRLTLTTDTPNCPSQTYKFALYSDDE